MPEHNVRYALRRNVNHGVLGEPIRGMTSKPVLGPETRRGFEVEAGRDGQGTATLSSRIIHAAKFARRGEMPYSASEELV